MKRIILITIYIIIISVSVSAGKVQYKYQICGDSMKPMLNNNKNCNIYNVETYNKQDANIGDVVCFNYYKPDYVYNNYQYVCHKLISYDETHFCTYSTYYNHYDRCMTWENMALKVIL